MIRANELFRVAYAGAALALALLAATSARADFFDDARRTFTTDIPHFFQDDIPCAFGGQPTSHTKTSCKSTSHPAKSADRPGKHADDGNAPADKPKEGADAPSSSDR